MRVGKFIDGLELSMPSVTLLVLLFWILALVPDLFFFWCALVMFIGLTDMVYLRRRVALWKDGYHQARQQWDDLYAIASRKGSPDA